jgi:hypothetical protein
MEFGCIGTSFDVKFVEDDGKAVGSFEGYGAVFGNIDSHGDVIEPGAFSASLLKAQREGRPLPSMYKMHGMDELEPIGVWEEMREDSNGLYVKGRLVGLETEKGRWTYAQLKEGALRGLSIGFNIPPHGSKSGSGKPGEPRRYIKAVNLREVSLVDHPSNALAFVREMKARFSSTTGIIRRAEDIKSIRDFEDHLREVGFSNAAAKSIASQGFKAGADPRDEDANAELRAALREAFGSVASKLTPKG